MADTTPCMSRLNGGYMTRILQKEKDDDEIRELSHLSTDYTKG